LKNLKLLYGWRKGYGKRDGSCDRVDVSGVVIIKLRVCVEIGVE
jgi:hypothetical protein